MRRMRDEEYRRQLHHSKTRPIQREGALWWVGAFAVATVVVACGALGILLIIGA
jgi:hypothetical protein